MTSIAEIFSQGEEVVSGQIVDSNAAWLSQQLNELGFAVKRHTAVGDDLDDLVGLIREIAARADCCICTGGLGPTVDDLTAEAVAIASGQALRFDAEAMRQIAAYFDNRLREMPAINRKQAYFPEQAIRIDNPAGTAPGFALQIQRCWFVFLPGVPSEMKAMFGEVREQLLQRFRLQPRSLVVLRSLGIGESTIQQALHDLTLPDGVRLGFRAATDEVQTKLSFPADHPLTEMRSLTRAVAKRIGDHVFAIDGLPDEAGGDLLTVVDRYLRESGHKLAVLETASGGMLAAKCHGREWLSSAMIAKDLQHAGKLCDTETMGDMAQAAQQLAKSLKQLQGTNLALVQLYQGSADDYRRPSGRIVLYNCLLTDSGVFHSQQNLAGATQTKQNQAALFSLDLIRRTIQNSCP